MKNIDYYRQSWKQLDNRDFQILSEIIELFRQGLKAKRKKSDMYLFSHKKTLKSMWLNFFFNSCCTQFDRKFLWKSGQFYKISLFLGKNAFTHSFTFQPCYLLTLRCRRHIYLSLNQIWAQSEKGAIASERTDCPCMAEITGLLADYGWTRPQWREGI